MRAPLPEACEALGTLYAGRIGVVLGSISRKGGGIPTAVCNALQAISRRSAANLDVFTVSDAFSAEDAAKWQPLEPRLFNAKGPQGLGYAPQVSAALDQSRLDLVHLHGLWLMLSHQVAAWHRRSGNPVVIAPHGMLDPWALANSGWKKRLARLAFEDNNLKHAACLHALNVSEATAMRRLGLENPIAVIPNGVDLPPHDLSAPPDFLEGENRSVLLFLGRLHPKKGCRELIESWALLKARAPSLARQWQLVIAGWDDGGHRAGLEALAKQRGLEANISFPGPLFDDAKLGAFARAEAFVLPSYSEGLPVAVLEAWAARLPVFMTPACNLPEGFLAGAAIEITTEPANIAHLMARHLASPDLAARGAAGRALVEERFSWSRVADMHIALYRWLTDSAPRPDFIQMARRSKNATAFSKQAPVSSTAT
jgi:glycosyltransferase involved in cell wall biosynthesis